METHLWFYNIGGLPEPEFKEEMGGFSIYLRKDIYTEEYLRRLGLNERQIEIFEYIKTHGSVSLSDLKKKISSVSEKTLYRDLQELVEKGILKKIGEKRGRKYELA